MTPKALLFAGLLSCATACSLVSGWSDLQGGGSGHDAGSEGDASGSGSGGSSGAGGSSGSSSGSGGSSGGGSGSSSGSIEDAAADVAVEAGPHGIGCYGNTCAIGDGCCITPVNITQARCTSSESTCSIGGFGGEFLACTDSRDCAGGQVCCYQKDSSSCAATCASPNEILCDSTAPSCPAGESCVQTSTGNGGFTLYVCQ